MSYILDALKRAESERGRGAVPNIHAQPAAMGAADASPPANWRFGFGLIAIVVVAMGAGLTWWGFAGDPIPSPPLVAAGAPAPLPAVPVASAVLPATAAPWQPRPTVPPAPLNLSLRKPALAVPRTPAPASPARIEKPDRASGTTAMAGASTPVAAASSTPANAAEERVYALKDLPDDIRNSLPVLTVGGATYSENPANRMLIVNGRLFHEGDKLMPELTLQQIKLRSAVLSYRGYRYGISY